MSFISRLIYARRGPFARIAKEVLALYGLEVPPQVEVGSRLQIVHRGFGTVIHPKTTIGNDVTIYHGVTLGRADAYLPGDRSLMERIIIEDRAVLCPGVKILCKEGVLTVGAGTVVGANSVLTRSTGRNEIWAGVPARKVSDRQVG